MRLRHSRCAATRSSVIIAEAQHALARNSFSPLRFPTRLDTPSRVTQNAGLAEEVDGRMSEATWTPENLPAEVRQLGDKPSASYPLNQARWVLLLAAAIVAISIGLFVLAEYGLNWWSGGICGVLVLV